MDLKNFPCQVCGGINYEAYNINTTEAETTVRCYTCLAVYPIEMLRPYHAEVDVEEPEEEYFTNTSVSREMVEYEVGMQELRS